MLNIINTIKRLLYKLIIRLVLFLLLENLKKLNYRYL